MTIFDALSFIGGLSLFLFGMSVLGKALERRAGNNLKYMLGKITGSKVGGILAGIGVTGIIQSSSATTVMVVGFVNSGLLTLAQSINVIIGANVGTCVSAWILSLSGISSTSFALSLLKPSSFTPIVALVGVIMYLFVKKQKTNDTGTILLGFAVLMTGMQIMSSSVAGLSEMPAFQSTLVAFENPFLGVLVGTVFTAIIQSSDASVGILLALAMTGKVTYGVAIPVIMGANIGTCITAILSSISATKNAKRAACAHLLFNVFGTVVLLTAFIAVRATINPAILSQPGSMYGIALAHTLFNIITMFMVAPMSSLLEKTVIKIIPASKQNEIESYLDDRLLNTPTLALEQCNMLMVDMASISVEAINDAIKSFSDYTKTRAQNIRDDEERTDKYEDILGSYLVKISAIHISAEDSAEAAKLIKMTGDYERISDHAVNLLESVEEMRDKKITLTPDAAKELETLGDAVKEIITLSYNAFVNTDLESAKKVEPLEQVIDGLKEQLRINHIKRLQLGNCSIEAGFIWSDLLTNLERTSDHCSNIAGTVIDLADYNMNLHAYLRAIKNDNPEFTESFNSYSQKYSV